MLGIFLFLVKNFKVFEFDNKCNYFNCSVYFKIGIQQIWFQYNFFQLLVCCEYVFYDFFKFLYFKIGDEMKFGKFNICFYGEEGVDVGGVICEWF